MSNIDVSFAGTLVSYRGQIYRQTRPVLGLTFSPVNDRSVNEGLPMSLIMLDSDPDGEALDHTEMI